MNLAHCPFCGEYSACPGCVDAEKFLVSCPACGCDGPTAGTLEDAIERWNNRTEPDETQSPEYQEFIISMLPYCMCAHRLCDGVLAGGPCDDIIEDDDRDDFRP